MRHISIILALSLLATPTIAVECMQQEAIYCCDMTFSQGENGNRSYKLLLDPVSSHGPYEATLDWNDGKARPMFRTEAIVFGRHNQDPTKKYPYGIKLFRNGQEVPLPGATEQAVDKIVLDKELNSAFRVVGSWDTTFYLSDCKK